MLINIIVFIKIVVFIDSAGQCIGQFAGFSLEKGGSGGNFYI